jgi:hypothetical protein
VFRVLDEGALLPPKASIIPVVARAIDQRVAFQVEHRVIGNLRHATADAAIDGEWPLDPTRMMSTMQAPGRPIRQAQGRGLRPDSLFVLDFPIRVM